MPVDKRGSVGFDGAVMDANGSGAMFDDIAARYDILNLVTSWGMDRRWRRRAVAALQVGPGDRVLDVAAGTCDVTMAVARTGALAVAADPSGAMLARGRDKCRRAGIEGLWVRACAEALPVASDAFDAAVVAFGVRNFADRGAGLRELFRSLAPGGRLAILELSLPSGWWAAPVRWYVRRAIPAVGGWLSRKDAYAYLARSMAAFPAPSAFARELEDAGFVAVRMHPQFPAVCTLFVARKPEAGGA